MNEDEIEKFNHERLEFSPQDQEKFQFFKDG